MSPWPRFFPVSLLPFYVSEKLSLSSHRSACYTVSSVIPSSRLSLPPPRLLWQYLPPLQNYLGLRGSFAEGVRLKGHGQMESLS